MYGQVGTDLGDEPLLLGRRSRFFVLVEQVADLLVIGSQQRNGVRRF
jgi:hypothetical protein